MAGVGEIGRDQLREYLLVLRCQAGDESAFTDLLDRFGPRTLQRISTGAWILTFVSLLFTAVGVGFNVWWAAQSFLRGQAGMDVIFREAMPFVWIVGAISLLVAVLSTAGVLLRFRAASLDEIRLRLAAVEQMLTDQAHGGEDVVA